MAASRLWRIPARTLPSGCSRRAGCSPSHAQSRFRVSPARPRPGTPRRLAAPSVSSIDSNAQPAASRSATGVAEGVWWHGVPAGSRFRSSWWAWVRAPPFRRGALEKRVRAARYSDPRAPARAKDVAPAEDFCTSRSTVQGAFARPLCCGLHETSLPAPDSDAHRAGPGLAVPRFTRIR